MRVFHAILFAVPALLASGCGPRPTGQLSTDLDSVVVTVSPAGPASIEGIARNGLDPLEVAARSSESGIIRLELRCQAGDSARAASVLLGEAPGIPSVVIVSDREKIVADLPGIRWEPRYTWSPDGRYIHLEANVILENSTDQTWRGVTMRILDSDGLNLASTTGRIDLPPGDTVIPWWNTRGTPLAPVLSYSWPTPAGWAAVLPILAPGAGPFIDGGQPKEWFLVSGDTLWVPHPSITVTSSTTQVPRGYEMETTVVSGSETRMAIRVVYPRTLQSGAVAGFEVPDTIILGGDAGSSLTFTGRITYPGRG